MGRRKAARGIAMLCLLAAAVLGWLLCSSPLFHRGLLYDDNERIAQQSDTYHTTGRISSPPDESGRIRFSASYFSGIDTIAVVKLAEPGGRLSFEWDCTVSMGKCKIVLVRGEEPDAIETLGEGTGQGRLENRSLLPGEYRIKLVGDRATMEGEYRLEYEQMEGQL